MKIWPYRTGSKSCRALSKALGCRILKRKNGTYKAPRGEVIINWGGHVLANRLSGGKIINDPHWVQAAANKLATFRMLDKKVALIPWTTSKETAKKWLAEGHKVVCRHILNGSAGSGIEIIDKKSLDIPSAPCYTKYVPKNHEWRIHVAFGKVIDSQRKVRNPDKEPTNWQVRSHDNGFIFVRNSGAPSGRCLKEAVQAVKELHLDFGAVDLITDKYDNVYILEVNSAPGLEGATVNSYSKAFRGLK